MRLAELAERADMTIATVKFYRREGLLHPGRLVTRTQAEYDDSHVERLLLVRALVDVAELPLAKVRRVIEAVTSPEVSTLDRMAIAQAALGPVSGEGAADVSDEALSRTTGWLHAREWPADPADPAVRRLASCWAACHDAAIGLDEARLDAYAAAMTQVAEIDIATVPDDPVQAARQVVLGTVLVDPLLIELRRHAQRHLAIHQSRTAVDRERG